MKRLWWKIRAAYWFRHYLEACTWKEGWYLGGVLVEEGEWWLY